LIDKYETNFKVKCIKENTTFGTALIFRNEIDIYSNNYKNNLIN